MAVKGVTISDLAPVASPITQLPGGLFEVEVLTGPVAGAYVNKRITTEQLQQIFASDKGPNASKSLLKEFRFYRKADHDADPDGGACFETDLDWSTCCGNTEAIIDFYRESDSEPFRNQRLVCVYDPTPTDPTHKAWIDGSFTGTRNPSKFVPVESAEAQLGNIPVFDPAKTNYLAGTVVQYTIGGEVFLYKVKTAGGPFAAPTDPQGKGTANLQAVAKPAGSTILLYENLSAYDSGDYDLPTSKLGRALNIATLAPKRLNLPALTLDSVPSAVLLSSNEDNTDPLEIWGALARDEGKGGAPSLIATLQPGERIKLLAAKTVRFYPNTGFAPGYVVESVSSGGGGGPALATRDLLDLSTDFMDAVMALTYTDCDADPAASPAGSFPGQQFDAIDSQGRNLHFYCTRGTYDPSAPAGTTGVGPAWHYSLKLG